MLVKKNYHTHTSRCGHANGNDEEYVLEAIKNGYTVLGFSDHVMLPNIEQKGIRGNYELLDDYINSINILKKKYANKIDIKIGFEAEYLPEFKDYYQDLLNSGKIDYLILGQHCYYDKNKHALVFYNEKHYDLETLFHYRDDLIKGMESGLFSYVAHPDLIMSGYGKWDDNAIIVAHQICQAAVKNKIPLEINLGGARYFRNKTTIPSGYPFDPFWEIVGMYPIEVVVGVDNHNPNEFGSDQSVAFDIIKYNKLKYNPDVKMYRERDTK